MAKIIERRERKKSGLDEDREFLMVAEAVSGDRFGDNCSAPRAAECYTDWLE